MSLLDNKVTAFTFTHAAQADTPVPAFASTAAFKSALDSQAVQLQAGLNGAIDWIATNGAPSVFINVKDLTYKASGSAQTTTGSITVGSNILTLASALDFINGQGININGNKEAVSLQIIAAATVSGNVTVTLNGVAFLVAVLAGDTIAQVATKIRGAAYAGWTAGGVALSDTVTFTSLTAGVKTDAVYSAGTTTAAGTMTTLTQGSADLITSIVSGAGTTSLILAASAITTVTGNVVAHDDTAALQNAVNYAISIGKTEITVPYGTYRYGVLTGTSGIVFIGDGVTLLGTTVLNLTSLSVLYPLKSDVVQRGFNVKSAPYNAVGDGVTNDTVAFQLVSAAITAAGGGKLIIPPGTYLVGKQTFAGATGLGYAYQGQSIINISNCTSPVIIEGNGAILKADPALRFGSFDPITGAVYSPVLPFTSQDYKANAYTGMVSLSSNSQVTIRDLELDGNQANIVLGGLWGDAGRQCSGSGLTLYSNKMVLTENVYVHHQALDGVYIRYDGLVETDSPKPHTLVNIKSEYNARQGLSIVGGIGIMVMNSKFNHTGQGTFGSSPAAGIDIEATTSICRNMVFIGCQAANNLGTGMVADSGDSAGATFHDCKFYGTVANSIWPNKPRFKFYNCLISGIAVSMYVAAKEEDRVLFRDCLFTPDRTFESNGVYGDRIANLASTQNPIFDNCVFRTSDVNVKLQSSSPPALYRNCKMIQNGSTAQANPSGTYEGINTIDMTTGSMNTSGLLNYGKLTATGTVLGASQTTDGQIINNNTPDLKTISVAGSIGAAQYQVNTIQYYYLTAVGQPGTRGDRIHNNQPSLGGIDYYECTVTGTPGTWVPVQLGVLGSIAATPLGVGFRAIVSGIVYTAIGTSSAADWKQMGLYVAVPATATSTGVVGSWAADANYAYFCYAANTWKRVAIATW